MNEKSKNTSAPLTHEDFQSHLYSLRVGRGGRVELEGCAFTTLQGWNSWVMGLRLIHPNLQTVEIGCQHYEDERANLIAKDKRKDQSRSSFRSVIDSRRVLQRLSSEMFDHDWKLEVVIESRRGDLRSINHVEFGSWDRGGAVQFGRAEYVEPDVLVQAKWQSGAVLNIARKAAVANSFHLEASLIHLDLSLSDFNGVSACLSSGDSIFGRTELISQANGMFGCTLDVNDIPLEHTENVYFIVKDSSGRKRFVHYGPNIGMLSQQVSTTPVRYLSRTPRSLLRIDRTESVVVVDSLYPSGPETLAVEGWTDIVVDALTARLLSNRSGTPSVTVGRMGAGRFSFHIPLVDASNRRPLPPGSYRVEFDCIESKSSSFAQVGNQLFAALGSLRGLKRLEASAGVGRNGSLTVKIRSSLTDFERSEYGRAATRKAARRLHTLENTAIFEVFNGRSSGDNPLPVFEELRRKRPDLKAYWAVADLSVPVPEGAKPIIIHSADYYRIVNSCEFLVTNNWLPPEMISRDSQRILQTWHGTPLKTLGLDRFHSGSERQRNRMKEMTSLWDGLVSQNPYSSEKFRKCYAYSGNILETGYPRNDILVNGDSATALQQARSSLGISPSQRILLYMPTWREDDREIFSELDLSQLRNELGDDWVVLVRGHSMNAKTQLESSDCSIIDVSSVNDPSQLYLLADILVTDYSSSMFDFTITSKPIAFYVPDMQRYSNELRGMYFDLSASAPGPVLATTTELTDFVKALPDSAKAYDEKYKRWRAEFNPWDDGRASERVVSFLLGEEIAAEPQSRH